MRSTSIFIGARALFNLAVQAVERGDPESAAILLTEAISEAQTEISVGGVRSQLVAVLTQIFALKVRILSQSVITAGLDSSEAELLREALDCQIILRREASSTSAHVRQRENA